MGRKEKNLKLWVKIFAGIGVMISAIILLLALVYGFFWLTDKILEFTDEYIVPAVNTGIKWVTGILGIISIIMLLRMGVYIIWYNHKNRAALKRLRRIKRESSKAERESRLTIKLAKREAWEEERLMYAAPYIITGVVAIGVMWLCSIYSDNCVLQGVVGITLYITGIVVVSQYRRIYRKKIEQRLGRILIKAAIKAVAIKSERKEEIEEFRKLNNLKQT